jgi:hypothetical protein
MARAQIIGDCRVVEGNRAEHQSHQSQLNKRPHRAFP